MAKSSKKPIVTWKFMLDLADRIHNAKMGKFLRLCNGTLQNGPDPTKRRTMHCGLGELYFAMTGKHPKFMKRLKDAPAKVNFASDPW